MNIILACDSEYGIGINNDLPSWNLKEDMIRFKKLTIGNGNNVVIMGKNTYISLKKKALPNRINIVVSETLFNELNIFRFIVYEGFFIFKNLKEAKEYADLVTSKNDGKIWIIGGAQLYESCITDYEINSLYITFIDKQFCCDTFLKKNTIEYIKNCDWINKINKKNEIFSYEYRDYEKK